MQTDSLPAEPQGDSGYLYLIVEFREEAFDLSPLSVGLPRWSSSNESACQEGDLNSIPGWEDPLKKEMATHSSTLAWEIP